MFDTVEKLDKALKEAHDRCVYELNKIDDYNVDKIYHYTNLAAGIKILESSALRFSDIRFCNDPDEIESGLSILRKAHRELFPIYQKHNLLFANSMNFLICSICYVLSNKDNEESARYNLEDALKKIDSALNAEKFFKSAVYVACLSEKNDDLRQWMPYADDGHGVAIGFSGFDGENHNITEDDLYLIRVSYKSEVEKIQYVRNVYDELYKIFNVTDVSLFQHLLNTVFLSIIHDVIACKSENYKDEEEWRLFYIEWSEEKTNDINFGIHKNLIKPHLDFKFRKDALLEIKLGPKSKEHLNEYSIKRALKRYGYNNAAISISKVEYR